MHPDDEKRMLRAERYIDALKYHIFVTDKILYKLASEVADLKCETPEENETCKQIVAGIESLKTLRKLLK